MKIEIEIEDEDAFRDLLARYQDKEKPDAEPKHVVESLLRWAYSEAWQ